MTDLVDRHKSQLHLHNGIEHRPSCLGTVTSYEVLRAAIDANPHLFSARISGDLWAIMVELNRNLPDGRMVSLDDVTKAMALRPVRQPFGCVQATGTAVGRNL